MRGVAERAVVGIVWRLDYDRSAGSANTVHLSYGLNNVGHMLDHMDERNLVEGIVAKG